MSDEALAVARSRNFGTGRDDMIAYAGAGAGAGAGAACAALLTPAAAPMCSAVGAKAGAWIADKVLARGSSMADLVAESWQGGGARYGRRRYVNEMVDLAAQWAGYEALYQAMVDAHGADIVRAAVGPMVPEEYVTTPKQRAELVTKIQQIEQSSSPEAIEVDRQKIPRRIYFKLPFDAPDVGAVNPYELFQFDASRWKGNYRPPLGSLARQILKLNTAELGALDAEPTKFRAVLLPQLPASKGSVAGPILAAGAVGMVVYLLKALKR